MATERAPLKKLEVDSRKSKSMTFSNLPSHQINRNTSLSNMEKPRSRSLTHNYYYPKVDPEEAPPETVAESGSIFLMIFINFLSNVVFSIVLPSLPDFINWVENNNGHPGDSSYLNGWAVAVNSLGTFLASPIFGWWADKRNFREVFFLSLVVMVLSNMWYALSPDIYQLFAARFMVGVAAANYAPAGAYLAYATSSEERAKIMAWNSAATVLGFVCGPAFSLVTAIPSLSFHFNIGSFTVYFNEYTASGWISALFGLLGLFAMIPFKEVKKPIASSPQAAMLKDASMRSFRSFTQVSNTSMPLKGVLLVLWMQFVLTSAFTIFETLGPVYTAAAPYGWGAKNLYYCSILFLGISVVSLAALFLLQVLLRFTNERYLMIIFTFVCTLGTGIFFEWGNAYVSLPRFLVAVFFASTGYANASAMLLAVFTKVVSETEQGVMMGWLSSVGSMSRMTVPIFSAYAFKYFGPNYIFLIVSLTCFVSNCVVICLYPLILPLIPEVEDLESPVAETRPGASIQ